jgi:hypothetical protein
MYLYRITTNILTTICNTRSRNFQGTNNCTYKPLWRLTWRLLCIDPKHVARNTPSTSNKLRVVYDCIILQYLSWPRWCVFGGSGGVLRNLILMLDGCRRSGDRLCASVATADVRESTVCIGTLYIRDWVVPRNGLNAVTRVSWFPCVLKANAEVVPQYPRCHYMLLM